MIRTTFFKAQSCQYCCKLPKKVFKKNKFILPFCLLLLLGVGNVWGQTTTITITNATIGGSSVLGSNNYNLGAERTWTQSSVNFGGKAITCNVSNTPSGAAACQYIQAQASNGVIYNTSALPGRIVSIKFTGTANVASSCFGGTSRLVNTTSANYTVGGTQIGIAQTNTTYTWNTDAATNYTFFCIKRGSTAQYFSSIEVTYESATSPTLTSPTVSSITTTSATLGATISSNGGAALTERGTVWGTAASPTGNLLVEGGTTVAAFTHSRTGLTANTAYTYRGYATNSVGTGYSADGTFTTLPLAPTVGTGNSITSSEFTANWSHPTMGAASYTYTVEVDDNSDFSSITTSVSSISSSNTSQAITGLAASTTYYFRVKAVNSQGSSDWSTTSAGVTTSAVATPTLNPVTLASALFSTYGTASTGVSFTANGSNLTAENITATAQTGCEVSTSLGSGYGASVSVAAGTTVYVRFTSSLAAGAYNSTTVVILSGGGASSNANVTTSSSGNSVSKATPTINTLPTATAITYGQTLASSTLSVGSASVAGSFAFTTPSTAPNGGTANQSVTFTPTDNANYNTTTTDVGVTVYKANQTITFGALTNKTTTDLPFNLTATASSGLTVSYSSSNTSVATVVGSTVTIVGAGQTTITASQAGDGNYNAATGVDQSLTVTQKIAGWDFNGLTSYGSSPQSPTNSAANVTVVGLTRASGFGTGGTAASNAWGGTGNGTATFTIKANSGYSLSLSEISAYNVRRSSSGATTGQWAYSLDGSTFTNIGSAITWADGASASSGHSQNYISLIGISALQNLSSATTVTFRIVNSGGSTGTWYLNNYQTGDDFIVYGKVEVDNSPIITINPSNLTSFTQNSSTPSAEQSYMVSGDYLTNDVTITPPTGFEISTSTGGSFSATNPITLTASGGNLVGEPVTIYVRQSANTLGSVSGNITHSSTGSNNPNVVVSGTRTGSYYSKSLGNLDEVGTWGINADGSGISPSNFSSDGIVYEIRNRTNATIGANWTVSGTASKVVVGNGTDATDFTIPSNYTLTGTIDVSANAELTIENTTSPTLGTLAPSSTLEYNNLAVTLSTAVTYRNLKLTGTGTKTFPGNTVTVSGNLTLDGCTLTGASSSPFSTILLAGNLTYSGVVAPPADANSITLSTNGTSSSTQTITGAGNIVRWFRIQTTTANTILLSSTGGSSNLLIGNSSGGGLTLSDGSVLNMNGNDLTLFNSSSASSAFVFNNTATLSTNSSTDFTIERTGNGNLGTIRFTTGASTIGSLTLNHTGSANKTLFIANQLSIANDLILTSGTLNAGVSTLTLNGSINRTSGNIDASNAAATVIFGGSSAQSIPASTFIGNINNLTLNNGNGLTTNQALTITNNLHLNNGKLDLLGNTLTIGTTSNVGTISGTFNNNSYIVAYDNGSNVIGKVKYFVNSTPSTSYNFPVGDATRYTPFVYTSNSCTLDNSNAYITVHTRASKVSQLNSNITDWINRYWELEPTGITAANYNVTFTYDANDLSSPGIQGNLVPVKYSAPDWYRPNNTLFTTGISQGTASAPGTNTLAWSNLTTFSKFTAVVDQATPLPIELVSFQANCSGDNKINVTWTTASEHNTSHYVVEHSRDGNEWQALTIVAAAGNSTSLLDYTYVHENPNSGINYYRLTQYDNDGLFEQFGHIKADCENASSTTILTTYPNPSDNSFYISLFTEDMEGEGVITLTDAKGTVVHTQDVTIQNGNTIFHMDNLNVAPGMYYIHVTNGNNSTFIVKHSLR
jgi:hypothetical protein